MHQVSHYRGVHHGWNRSAVERSVPMAAKTMIALLFGFFLVAASAQDLDGCTPEAVARCYDQYSDMLFHLADQPNAVGVNDEDDSKACRDIKEKAPCHLNLTKCSHDVRSTLRQRENGYEAARDIVCEVTPWIDFGKAYQCVDRNLPGCPEPYGPPLHADQPGPPPYHPFCEYYERDIKCLKFRFNSSCELTLEQVRAAYIRTYDALALLRDCKKSPPADARKPSPQEDTKKRSPPEDPAKPSTPEDTRKPSPPEDAKKPSPPEDPAKPSTPEDTRKPSSPEDARKPSTPEDGKKPNSSAAFLQPGVALGIILLTLLQQRLTTP